MTEKRALSPDLRLNRAYRTSLIVKADSHTRRKSRTTRKVSPRRQTSRAASPPILAPSRPWLQASPKQKASPKQRNNKQRPDSRSGARRALGLKRHANVVTRSLRWT